MVFDTKVGSCTGCGAQVSSFVTYCPFCGLDMVKAKVEPLEETLASVDENSGSSEQSDKDNLAGLYNPPYIARDKSGIGVGASVDVEKPISFQEVSTAKARASNAPLTTFNLPKQAVVEEIPEETPSSKGYLIPMSLMLMGSQFLMLALLIALFSTKGILTLEWKTSTAVAFFILSIPLLTFGFKWLGDSKKEPSALMDIRKK